MVIPSNYRGISLYQSRRTIRPHLSVSASRVEYYFPILYNTDVRQEYKAVTNMGEKDIVEKTLESYNEVFADIVNVLLFKGEQIIQPEDLVDQTPRAMYKADDKIREVERDVAKRWVKTISGLPASAWRTRRKQIRISPCG